jgi:NAD(P)-dependent dehydrogenase (short-subunit alcohol dehydrogenase family)
VLTDVAPTGLRVVATKPGTDWRGLEAAADEVRAAGRRAITAMVDVRSADQIQQAIELADRTFGRIDILVNNAAAPPGADRVPVVELPEAAWHVILETNLTGTYLCSRAVAAFMLARGTPGRIINMSSNCGKVGYARLAAYCASKFGVIGFTQALAMELAPHGITVNAICPGSADTDRLDFLGRRPDGSYDEALRARAIAERAAQIPLGRLATADDVAELAAFLGSDAAAYVTGQAINVAGGAIMH